MSKENYVKQELCRQIMQLNLEQLQKLTDLISDSNIDGLSNPDEVLTCDRNQVFSLHSALLHKRKKLLE